MVIGTGLGFRNEIACDLLADPRVVDFVEIVAETCFSQRAARRQARAISEVWPVIPHGVKLSLGSGDGIDLDRVTKLAKLAVELRSPMISEHVAFTRAGDIEVGHLTQLPRTREAVQVVARNVAAARRRLPDVPLLLENIAWSVRWPDDELDEPSFYHAVVAATGCPLLLDVSNLYANAVNEGLDPLAVLNRYPLDRVAMLHVAGGVWNDGFYFDTHADAIPPPVMGLVTHILAARDVPVLIERDANLVWPELVREVTEIKAMQRSSHASVLRPQPAPDRVPSARFGSGLAPNEATFARNPHERFIAAQRELAERLVRDRDDGVVAFQHHQVMRARQVLQRKRIDDALPLLGHLGAIPRVRDLAENAVAQPRTRLAAAPNDAWRIAVVARQVPELADLAELDGLVLRARFTGAPLRPRRGPFLGFARLASGERVRASKGLGVNAEVTLRPTRGNIWPTI